MINYIWNELEEYPEILERIQSVINFIFVISIILDVYVGIAILWGIFYTFILER